MSECSTKEDFILVTGLSILKISITFVFDRTLAQNLYLAYFEMRAFFSSTGKSSFSDQGDDLLRLLFHQADLTGPDGLMMRLSQSAELDHGGELLFVVCDAYLAKNDYDMFLSK